MQQFEVNVYVSGAAMYVISPTEVGTTSTTQELFYTHTLKLLSRMNILMASLWS